MILLMVIANGVKQSYLKKQIASYLAMTNSR